ncbi:MAG TPA: GNAT family N-acetyltransferase [Ilumatobacter sp.]|nr:GNAT family N-acetyltransferase [Ilumatobacter sp.]
MRRFELQTDRLSLRILARSDITEFVRYRNVAEVARFQQWTLPYTRDLAHALVDEMDRLDGPTPGEWLQIAVERRVDSQLVGDLAVWLDDAGTTAMLGYTLAPEFQGHGYATEAVAALVEALFAGARRRPPVHRISATLDPANGASARVLEACGFTYEGTARSAAFVRGEWSDDARFGLLRPDWEAWLARPTTSPHTFELSELTNDDVRPLLRLGPAFSQRTMVSPIGVSLGEALLPPTEDGHVVVPWYRGVRADGELVGFVMVAEPHPSVPHPYLWRLTIDRRHQLRGLGRRTVLAVAEHWSAAGATTLLVSFVPDLPGNPQRFYERLGFVPTGHVEDGQIEAALDLTTRGG